MANVRIEFNHLPPLATIAATAMFVRDTNAPTKKGKHEEIAI
jgi:hypothetical protein